MHNSSLYEHLWDVKFQILKLVKMVANQPNPQGSPKPPFVHVVHKVKASGENVLVTYRLAL